MDHLGGHQASCEERSSLNSPLPSLQSACAAADRSTGTEVGNVCTSEANESMAVSAWRTALSSISGNADTCAWLRKRKAQTALTRAARQQWGVKREQGEREERGEGWYFRVMRAQDPLTLRAQKSLLGKHLSDPLRACG